MNCKQKASLWLGIILFCLANSYAPWNYVSDIGQGVEAATPAGHYCIFDTPKAVEGLGLEVDVARVVIQSAVIIVFTLGLLAAFCTCNRSKGQAEG